MCHGRKKCASFIKNMFHKRYLKRTYNYKLSSFTELSIKTVLSQFTLETFKCLQIEILKFCNGLSPPLIKDVFKLRAENPHDLEHASEISRPMVKSM